MLQDFLNKGQMRVNEKGKFEIMDPKWQNAQTLVVHKTPQKQQSQ
mgnify:CR=1 FL=1